MSMHNRTKLPVGIVLRDTGLVIVTLVLWALALRDGGLTIQVLAGLATVLVGYLLHEWGHLVGCWARGSVVRYPDRVTAPFLFNFDVGRNDRRQFNAMVAGGFIASLLFVVLLVLVVPLHTLAGKIALGLTVIGVIATFILEVPTAWRVYRGGPLPQAGPAFVGDPSSQA